MALNYSLSPLRWSRTRPVNGEEGRMPLSLGLHDDVSQLFRSFFSSLPSWASNADDGYDFYPTADLQETESGLKLSMELAGVDEKDIELSLNDEGLVIRGEKKEEKEDKGSGYHHIERRYGSFQRAIAFPFSIDTDKVEAKFKNGLLTVNLPRSTKEQSTVKKIDIKTH